jgi:NAD/NADP transhydrogenase beta subunit
MNSPAQPPAQTFQARLKSTTLVHWAIVASSVMFIVLAEMVGPKTQFGERTEIVVMLLAFFGLMNAAVAFYARKLWVSGSEEVLRLNPSDTTAAQRWMQGSILSVAFSESIVLFGFVLRMIGAQTKVVWAFYAAGLALMLMFVPRRP